MRDQALLDKIDLHLIRVLHTVLIERSVSRAALRLGMYQPAVSAALKRLRELAGDPLLVRSGPGMVPTDAGLRMIEPTANILHAAEVLTTGRQYCERFIESLPVKILECPIEFPQLMYYQLWHERTHASASARWLREQIKSAAAALRKGEAASGPAVPAIVTSAGQARAALPGSRIKPVLSTSKRSGMTAKSAGMTAKGSRVAAKQSGLTPR